MEKTYSKQESDRKQVKSLTPQNDSDIDSQVYGDDTHISTQITTNYYYNPRNE
ncbi:hypothetical protein [Clostridium sp. OS1-26]|uniref:hypothetical protein n=1 Tax=Clostridium sp. OS1-26 TaxID=3070681 RepID=UPI0027DED098|nr:hypothetical protein [Clostridium sp. OS1-26]WML35734.1 hypothetical protein RCG18_03005 [Clostridium sp. OS1-26]